MGNTFNRRSALAIPIAITAFTAATGYAGSALAQPPECAFVDYLPTEGLSQRPDGPILDVGVLSDADRDEVPRSGPPLNSIPVPALNSLPAVAHFLPPETGAQALPPQAWLGVPGVQIYPINNHSYYRCRYW
jgi:hypothetical protein